MWVDYLATQVLEGATIDRDQALGILETSDEELLEVLQASFRIRRRHFGRRVKVHVLQNAKKGGCPEDCGFCSQSKHFATDVPAETVLPREQLVSAARAAVAAGASTYCMATATHGPSSRELDELCAAVEQIRGEFPDLGVCASLGFLTDEKARRLKKAGVTRYNHNLETAPGRFSKLVTTHGFQDRVDTVRRAKAAGMEACCGGIMGTGESAEDRVALAFALRELDVESVPVNFLDPRPGTPLADLSRLSPQDGLRALAMFRFVHPDKDVRVAGGREACLGALQALALYPANSLFANGYLTTGGQGESADWTMIRQAGFVGVRDE